MSAFDGKFDGIWGSDWLLPAFTQKDAFCGVFGMIAHRVDAASALIMILNANQLN